MEANSWIALRFDATNPGSWVAHCHIEWHLDMGMAMVFSYGQTLIPSPPAGYVAGLITYSQLVQLEEQYIVVSFVTIVFCV